MDRIERANRDALIAEAYEGGATLEEIGRTWGLTKMRVWQIVERLGIRRVGAARVRPGIARTVRLTPLANRLVETVAARCGGHVRLSDVVEHVLRVHAGALTGEELRPQ